MAEANIKPPTLFQEAVIDHINRRLHTGTMNESAECVVVVP